MQSKMDSWIEQVCNVGSGFIVSLVFWTLVVVPVWNLPVNMTENLAITACFTVVSILRGYIWRRLFNKWTLRKLEKERSRSANTKHSKEARCLYNGVPNSYRAS